MPEERVPYGRQDAQVLTELMGMALHTVLRRGDMLITRVPGGWIYRVAANQGGLMQPVFVPLPGGGR